MMSHSSSLFVENAANFPSNYAGRCQAAAVEVAKLLSNLFPTIGSNHAADKKGSIGDTAKLREELQNVGCNLHARDLRVEAVQCALRQEVEARKETVRQQQQIISKINQSGHKLQLPPEVIERVWFLYDEANRPERESRWKHPISPWMNPLREAFGRDYFTSSVLKFCADEVKEETLRTSDPAKLYVTFFHTPTAASDGCKRLEFPLRFRERWSTLHFNISEANNDYNAALFHRCAPAWPYLDHIVFKPVEERRSREFPFGGIQPPSTFGFSIPPPLFPRKLKSADLSVGYLALLKAFIVGVASLTVAKIEGDLTTNLYSNIMPNLPRDLKSLKLCFELSYEEEAGRGNEVRLLNVVQTPNLKTLELVHFTAATCMKVLAPFEGIALRTLVLRPHHLHEFRLGNGMIERINKLFPRLSFLGVVPTGVVEDGWTEEIDRHTPRSEIELFSFIVEIFTLICGKPNKDPVLKHLTGLEVPFPSPCAFERIRGALEYRRSLPDVTRIDKLILDCCLPDGQFYIHDYCSRFTESLQFIVKDVVLVYQEKCTECNYTLSDGPQQMWY